MVILEDIAGFLNRRFPESLKESWDNVGLMTGDRAQEISKVLVCLDATSDTVKEAADFGAELIISHHPLIFSPVKKIVENEENGSILRTLIRNDISVYSLHTNFDKARGGMNDLLCEKLGLSDVREYLDEELKFPSGKDIENFGRVGELSSPMTLDDFADYVKMSLDCRALKLFGDGGDRVSKVALCTGSGGDMIYAAYNSGADVYLTADLGHHDAQTAAELGLNLIDAGHFETENIICEFLYDLLSSEFPDLLIKKSQAEPFFRSI